MNLDFKDTAGWKFMQQQERNEEFFRRQRQRERELERKKREKERRNHEENTDT